MVVAIVAMATPSAAAGGQLAAQRLDVLGTASLEGDAAALFFVVGDGGFTWDATAASIVVERTYGNFTAVDHPLYRDVYLQREYGPAVTETAEYADSSLLGRASRAGGGFLLVGLPGTEATATTRAAFAVESVQDPRFDQGARPDVATEDGVVASIHEQMPGEYLNATFLDGDFLLRGDFTLQLVDVDYALQTPEGDVEQRTGDFETGRAGPVATGRVETQRITLLDAVVRIHVPTDAFLFTVSPAVAMQGELRAEAPEGALELPGAPLAPGESARWTGEARLLLSPAAGRVHVADGDAGIASQGARVPAGPLPGAWALGLLLLAATLAAAAVLARRRRDPREDLDAALLAMEERRWSDALPRLTRALARRPDDPLLLLDKALCLEETGRLREAAKGYEAALRRAPRNADAHFYYARTLAKLREAGASRAHLEEALDLDPRLGELARREAAFHALRP